MDTWVCQGHARVEKLLPLLGPFINLFNSCRLGLYFFDSWVTRVDSFRKQSSLLLHECLKPVAGRDGGPRALHLVYCGRRNDDLSSLRVDLDLAVISLLFSELVFVLADVFLEL